MEPMDIEQPIVTDTQKQKISKIVQLLGTIQNARTSDEADDAMILINNMLNGNDALILLNSKEIKPFLYEGLKHLGSDVGRLALLAFQKCAEDPQSISVLDDQLVLDTFVETIKSGTVAAADRVVSIFKKMANFPAGLKILFHTSQISSFKKLLQANETVKFRILDMFCSIAVLSNDAFEYCRSSSFLQDIISTVASEDVLQLMNGIELVERLLLTEKGVLFLETSGTLAQLFKDLKANDPFLKPRIISFFGQFSSQGGKSIEFIKENKLLPILLDSLLEGSYEAKAASIVAISRIASTLEGLKTIFSDGKLMAEYLDFVNDTTDLQHAFLHSFADAMHNQAKNSSTESEQLWQNICGHFKNRQGAVEPVLKIVVPYIRQPIVERKFAVFDLLSALAEYKFGVVALMEYPGLYEHVTNREVENSKLGKEWQYSIVQKMVKTIEKNPDVVSRHVYNELMQYLKGGVFYVKGTSVAEIATRDAT